MGIIEMTFYILIALLNLLNGGNDTIIWSGMIKATGNVHLRYMLKASVHYSITYCLMVMLLRNVESCNIICTSLIIVVMVLGYFLGQTAEVHRM